MKVYNEIVIDMNPESSTFEEVLYEDSFEHSGEFAMKLYRKWKNPFEDLWEDIKDIGEGVVESVVEDKFGGDYETGEEKEIRAAMEASAMQKQAGDIQVNALPSLPSISNVGSTRFTGSVSAIPGGFQPLPQTAGGRKKLYQLSQFHGGINQKSSPRDIADNECQEAKNVTFSSVGRITLLGDCLNKDNAPRTFPALSDPSASPLSGCGLFEFNSIASIEGHTGLGYRILLTSEGDHIDAIDTINDNAQGWMDFGKVSTGSGDSDHNVAPIFYAAGNGVYVGESNWTQQSADRNKRMAKIFVERKDFNGAQTTEDWAEGAALINSPTRHSSEAAGKVYLENSDRDAEGSAISFTVASNYGASVVHIGTDGDVAGGWDGTYIFYISWIFDGGCETGLTALDSGLIAASETLYFNFSCKAYWSSSSKYHIGMDAGETTYADGEPRIEGARIYFKKTGTAERWLLAEVSLVDGIKGALDSTYTPWYESSNVFSLGSNLLTSAIIFENPPEVYSYASLNAYYANETYDKSSDTAANGVGPEPLELRYKTAVVGPSGIVFIGNVEFDYKHMSDTMMFSMPNKPGVFPKFNVFDAPSSDGSPIQALASFRDQILQFKTNTMCVINVSNPAEFYTQASYRDCGVQNKCQVFTTSFGVIFANAHGCYIYDGSKVISLTAGKFDITDWGLQESSHHSSSAYIPCVGYDPRSQNIIVLKNIGEDSSTDDAWVYNIVTQSWTEGIDMITNSNGTRHTNFIITSQGYSGTIKDGYLTIKSNVDSEVLNYNHDKSEDTDAQTITYITKDLDFGLPSQTKKLFKVYITYKGNPPSTIYYRTDGSSTARGFTETNWSAAGVNDYEVATLVPDSLGESTGWKSMSIYMTGSADADFEINDISILYRARPIK